MKANKTPRTPGPYWIKKAQQDPKNNPDLHDNLIMAETPREINQGTPSLCVIATIDNADEDAEFIVKACNNFDGLVSALKSVHADLTGIISESVSIETDGNGNEILSPMAETVQEIEQALESADEEA